MYKIAAFSLFFALHKVFVPNKVTLIFNIIITCVISELTFHMFLDVIFINMLTRLNNTYTCRCLHIDNRCLHTFFCQEIVRKVKN